MYSTYLGGSDAEDEIDISVDDNGRAYLSGSTESPDFPEVKPIAGVPSSVFLSVIGAGNRLVDTPRLPVVPGDGNLFHSGSGVTVGPNGTAYVTGWGSSGFVTAVRLRMKFAHRRHAEE